MNKKPSKNFLDSLNNSKKDFQNNTKKIGKSIKRSENNIKKEIKSLRKKDVIIFLFVLISAIAIICFLRNYNPEQLIDYLGIKNLYVTIFFFAVTGGVSFLTATYFYITYFLFLASGANPLLLALAVCLGLTIGDLFFYFVGLRGSPIFQNYFKRKDNMKKVETIQNKMRKYEFWTIYLYVGFLPFPKDILSFALGFFGHRLRNIVIPLILGNFTYNTILAYLFLFGFV